MDKYAIVNGESVVNVCLWDGITPWEPPPGTQVVLLQPGDHAEPGGSYIDGVFIPAPRPEAPPEGEDQEELLAVVTNALLTVPEVQQALAQAGVEVELDEKGNPIGIKVPVKETGEIEVPGEIITP